MEIPEQYKYAVTPHALVDGAAEAIAFCTAAFGATKSFRLEGDDGRIAHAEIRIHRSTLMLGDAEAPASPPSAAVSPSVVPPVHVPDGDALTGRAVAAGAEPLTAPADMAYGARQSMLRDPFGHVWIFLTPLSG